MTNYDEKINIVMRVVHRTCIINFSGSSAFLYSLYSRQVRTRA